MQESMSTERSNTSPNSNSNMEARKRSVDLTKGPYLASARKTIIAAVDEMEQENNELRKMSDRQSAEIQMLRNENNNLRLLFKLSNI